MRKRMMSRAKRIAVAFSAVLMMLAVFSEIDGFGWLSYNLPSEYEAYAQDDNYGMRLGTEGIEKNSHIYFGDLGAAHDGTKFASQKNRTFYWRVLDVQDTKMFLMSENLVGDSHNGKAKKVQYSKGIIGSAFNNWNNSNMPGWCDSFAKNVFSNAERASIVPKREYPGGYDIGLYAFVHQMFSDHMEAVTEEIEVYCSSNDVDETLVYIPSFREVTKYLGHKLAHRDGEYALRDPVDSSYVTICRVNAVTPRVLYYWYCCDYSDATYDSVRNIDHYWMRPVIDLYDSKVLFTNRVGVKDYLNAEDPKLNTVPTVSNYDEIELTISDPSRMDFKASVRSIYEPTGEVIISIDNTSRIGKENEYISAMLVNDKGEILKYSRVLDCSKYTANSMPEDVILDMKDCMQALDPDDDSLSLYVFSERYDGKGKTSYASPLIKMDNSDMESYYVYFDLNGRGSPMPPIQRVADNGRVKKPNPEPIAPGYRLTSWAEKHGEKWWNWDFDEYLVQGDNVHLYAQWEPNSYDIEFFKEDGTGEKMDNQSRIFDDGKKLPKCTYEAPENAKFNGWYRKTEDDDGNERLYYFEDESTDNVAEPLEDGLLYALHANWAYEFTVKYDTQSITKAPESGKASAETGWKVDPPQMDPVPGYTFEGWYTEPYCSDGTEWDFDTELDSDMILYAKFSGHPYTISFDPSGGSGEMEDQNRIMNDNVELPECTFTPPQHERNSAFIGWNTKPNGDGVFYEDKSTEIINVFGLEDATITLYAQWGIPYEISFNATDGSFDDNEKIRTRLTTPTHELEELEPAPVNRPYYYPGRPAAMFEGWWTEPDGGVQINDCSFFNEDTTLYAHWETPSGYSTITLDPMGGKVTPGTMTTDYFGKLCGTLPEATDKDGFFFIGWYTKQEGGTSVEEDASFANDTTLYARWGDVNKYVYRVVSFDLNGRGDKVPSPQIINAAGDNKVDKPEVDPTEDGYTVEGWYKEKECINEWDFDNDTLSEDETTLYANWVGNSYTISFEPGKGVENEQTGHMEDQQRFVGDGVSLPDCLYLPPAHSSGALFTGWNTKADGSGEHFDDRSTRDVATGGKVTLYAQWSDTRVAVFDLNGHGDKSPAPQMRGQMHEYKLTKPDPEPTEVGYKFTGWYTSEECKPEEKWDFDNDSLTKPLTTLYAGWEPIAYTVKFDANAPAKTDVSGSMDDQDRLFDDGKALPKAAYVVTDKVDSARSFVFSGWNTSDDGSGDAFGDQDSQNITDTEGEVTLYAMWNIAQITTSRLPRGRQGEAYSATLTQTGLVNVYWEVIEGKLPEGIELDDSTGVISGTSDQAGRFDFKVAVTGYYLWDEGTMETLSKPLSITLRQIDPEPLIIQFIEGMNGLWEKGNKTDLSFKTNGPFEMFEGIDVDGVELEKGRDYTAEEGSTIINLKPSYLETLSDGSHILTAHYNDGQEPFAQFTIASKPEPPEPDNDDKDKDNDKEEDVSPVPDDNNNDSTPDNNDHNGNGNGNGNKRRSANTGDSNHIAIWISLMLATFSAIICLIIVRQRRRI